MLPQPFHHDRFDGADLDRPASAAPPRHRLVILSTPRSGSYLLCRQLWRAGIGVPTEYLRPQTMHALASRWSLPRDLAAYLDEVERRRTTAEGVFAAKLQPLHLRAHPLALERWVARADLLVVLERRDRLAQAASWQVSLATGYWSSDATPGPRAEGMTVDDTRSARDLAAQLEREHRWIDAVCARAGRPVLKLPYEALVDDQPGTVAAVAARLGLAPGAFRLPAPEAKGAGALAGVERARADLLAALRAGR